MRIKHQDKNEIFEICKIQIEGTTILANTLNKIDPKYEENLNVATKYSTEQKKAIALKWK